MNSCLKTEHLTHEISFTIISLSSLAVTLNLTLLLAVEVIDNISFFNFKDKYFIIQGLIVEQYLRLKTKETRTSMKLRDVILKV